MSSFSPAMFRAILFRAIVEEHEKWLHNPFRQIIPDIKIYIIRDNNQTKTIQERLNEREMMSGLPLSDAVHLIAQCSIPGNTCNSNHTLFF